MPLVKQNNSQPRAAKSFHDPLETEAKKTTRVPLFFTPRFSYSTFHAQNNTIPSELTRHHLRFLTQNLILFPLEGGGRLYSLIA